MVDDISHEGLRLLLREEGVSFERLKTWKASRDPDYAAKKARVEHLYAIADGEVTAEDGEPEAVFCMDEFGPLNLMPHPGRQRAERGGRHKDSDREPRRRRRATYNRYGGVRHLFAALDPARDKLYGHIKPLRRRTQFLEFCRYLRTLCHPTVRIAIVCDNHGGRDPAGRSRPPSSRRHVEMEHATRLRNGSGHAPGAETRGARPVPGSSVPQRSSRPSPCKSRPSPGACR